MNRTHDPHITTAPFAIWSIPSCCRYNTLQHMVMILVHSELLVTSIKASIR